MNKAAILSQFGQKANGAICEEMNTLLSIGENEVGGPQSIKVTPAVLFG